MVLLCSGCCNEAPLMVSMGGASFIMVLKSMLGWTSRLLSMMVGTDCR